MVSYNGWNILDFLYKLTIMNDDDLLIYISDTLPYKWTTLYLTRKTVNQKQTILDLP